MTLFQRQSSLYKEDSSGDIDLLRRNFHKMCQIFHPAFF